MASLGQLLAALATALPLAVITAAVAAGPLASLRRVRAARQWPRAAGLVVESGIASRHVRLRRSIGIAQERTALRYGPRVVYQYEVGGQRFLGQRLRLGDTLISADTRAAERDAARYPVGRQVTVWYNPADPADAALELRAGWGTRAQLLAALLLLLLTLAVPLLLLS